MITVVTEKGGDRMITYSLPPAEAVVAAYKQYTCHNWTTWEYPKPEDEPLFKRGKIINRDGYQYRRVSCGTWEANEPVTTLA